MDVINPATGEREETYEEDTREDVDAALDRATSAFGEWRDRSIRDREHLLDAAGSVLRENKPFCDGAHTEIGSTDDN